MLDLDQIRKRFNWYYLQYKLNTGLYVKKRVSLLVNNIFKLYIFFNLI